MYENEEEFVYQFRQNVLREKTSLWM